MSDRLPPNYYPTEERRPKTNEYISRITTIHHEGSLDAYSIPPGHPFILSITDETVPFMITDEGERLQALATVHIVPNDERRHIESIATASSSLAFFISAEGVLFAQPFDSKQLAAGEACVTDDVRPIPLDERILIREKAFGILACVDSYSQTLELCGIGNIGKTGPKEFIVIAPGNHLV